jgi:hypothetical protein
MAASSIVLDRPTPTKDGNSGFGTLSGSFVDASVTYADALAVVTPHFQATPSPRIVYIANGIAANQYTFIAFGRVW